MSTRDGRLARLRPDELDAAQAELYALIVGGPRGTGSAAAPLVDDEGRLAGPFNAMLVAPAIGTALQGVGAAVRYHGVLPDRAREIAILVVARQQRSAFEVFVHEVAGRATGLTDAELDALRLGRYDLLPAAEATVATTTAALAQRADLDDAEYAEAHAAIGGDGLVELTTLVGYYTTLALQMRVFGVDRT